MADMPGLALIQLHDDQPPTHYVPLADLVDLTEERVGPISGEGARYAYSKYGPPDVEKRRLVSEWTDV
jgi:hypothetical protein